MSSDLPISSSIPTCSSMEETSLYAYAEFMESGVTPYVHCHETCSICFNKLTKAIRIDRCGHCFHMDCLADWFACRTKPNTCPMCREELFRKEDELSAILSIFGSADFRWEKFDIPGALEANIPHIEPVNGNLIPSVLSVPKDAMTRIDCRMASSALVLAGNTAIAVATVQGVPLGEHEISEYSHIVWAVYTFLESKDGEKMQVSTMPMEILLGASKVLDDAGLDVDVDAIWPDDIVDLEDDPARRAVHLAFFVTWILWKNLGAAE